MLSSDVAALDTLIDDGLVFTGPFGDVVGKAADLESHATGIIRFTEMTPSEIQSRTYGDIAVVVVRMAVAGMYAGAAFAGPYRYTRVWQRGSDHRWRIVAGHVSAIQL